MNWETRMLTTTPQVLICVNLNFDDKIKIILPKNKKSGPSRENRDKALGLGTKGGFYSKRAEAFVISPNRST